MIRKWGPLLISSLLLTLLFEGLAVLNWIPKHLIPPPSLVFQSFLKEQETFLHAFLETFLHVLGGLGCSIVLGLGASLFLSLNPFIRRAVFPFTVFFQTVPIIALAPLLVIYFGFGTPTVIASSFIVSLFPVLANTLAGLEQVNPQFLELFRVYKASSWQILWELRLPSAYNSIMSGIKVASGLAIIGTVAGEFVAGGGLGALIDSARTQQRVDFVFVCLILLSAMGILLLAAIEGVNLWLRSLRPWGQSLEKEF